MLGDGLRRFETKTTKKTFETDSTKIQHKQVKKFKLKEYVYNLNHFGDEFDHGIKHSRSIVRL